MTHKPQYVQTRWEDPQFDIMAKVSCPKCYGRGYVGINRTHQLAQPCSCLRHQKKQEEPKPIGEFYR